MDSKMSNKICEIVKLQQILKKWRKVASSKKTSPGGGGGKSIKFLKKTLSFSDHNALQGMARDSAVPKGSLAVCVGEEMKRFVIPMAYLRCQAFDILLKEAEEEFGFQQEGILRIPCQVSLFEEVIKLLDENQDAEMIQDYVFTAANNTMACSLAESPITNTHRPQSPVCR